VWVLFLQNTLRESPSLQHIYAYRYKKIYTSIHIGICMQCHSARNPLLVRAQSTPCYQPRPATQPSLKGTSSLPQSFVQCGHLYVYNFIYFCLHNILQMPNVAYVCRQNRPNPIQRQNRLYPWTILLLRLFGCVCAASLLLVALLSLATLTALTALTTRFRRRGGRSASTLMRFPDVSVVDISVSWVSNIAPHADLLPRSGYTGRLSR